MPSSADHANRDGASSEPPEDAAQGSVSSPWADRVRALRNVPLVLRILWKAGRSIVVWGLVLRVIQPIASLGIGVVAAEIVYGVTKAIEHQPPLSHFWWWVGAEVGLALFSGILTRSMDYTDQILADRYTNHVSVQVMEQAARLDLTTYENPEFYDRLERARVQATDRLAMIQQMGRLFQQIIMTLIWSTVLIYRSPLMILPLAAGVLPSFIGETHFAFLGYEKNFRQTPRKRIMDYLRQVGGSKESAKELKLFNLSDYFTNRFRDLSQGIYEENVALANRKMLWGGLLSLISTIGYYGAYIYAIYQATTGQYPNIAAFVLVTQAIQHVQFEFPAGVLDRFRHCGSGPVPHRSDRFLRDEADGTKSAQSASRAPAHPPRLRIPQRLLCLSRHGTKGAEKLQLQHSARRTHCPDRRKRPGQDHCGQAYYAPL